MITCLRVLVVALATIASCTALKAQWRNAEVMPDGGWISAFDMTGDTLLCGGVRLFRSTDRGESWREIETWPPRNQIAQIVRSGDAYLINSDSALWRSTDLGETWSIARAWGPDFDGRLARHRDGSLVLAVGNDSVYRSTDDGMSLRGLGPHPINVDPLALLALDDRLLLGTYKGLFISLNDGRSWDSVRMTPSVNEVPNALHELSDGTIAAGCTNGYFVSSDRGVTWSKKSTGLNEGGRKVISLTSSGDSIWAGMYGATIAFSSNRGDRWNYQFVADAATSVHQIEKRGDSIWATTTHDGLQISTNAGVRFMPRRNGMRENIGAIGIFDCGTYVLATTGKGILKSTDGGARWYPSDSVESYGRFPRPYSITTIVPKGDTLYLSSYLDGIFRSTDRGAYWTRVDIARESFDEVYGMTFVGDTMVLSSRSRGVLRFIDRGNWFSRADTTPGVTGGVLTRRGDTLFCGGSAIWRSLDRGRSWTRVHEAPAAPVRVSSIVITDDGTVYALNGMPGTTILWRSNDGGATWSEADAGLERSPFRIPVGLASAGNDVFVGFTGNFLAPRGIHRTTDGGSSWHEVTSGRIRPIDIYALGRHGDRLLAGTSVYGIWRSSIDELRPMSAPVEDRSDGIVLWPNPAMSVVRLANVPRGASITVVDLLGKVVARAHGDAINVASLAAGHYLCVVRDRAARVFASRALSIAR